MPLFLFLSSISAMPFFDVQKRLGLNLDHWMTIQSAEQPHKIPGRCHAFEKEWIECAHGIGGIRAEKECKIEFDDFVECLLRHKTVRKWWRWELNYFLVSLGLLFSVFNWPLGSGLLNVNWQNFSGETPSLLKYHVKEVKCLQIWGGPSVPQCSSASSHMFSFALHPALATGLEIACVCIFPFLL